MPVLVEAISVIVRIEAVRRVLGNDWSRFVELVENQTLCCDNELARVGFMVRPDVEAFVQLLESRGFRYRDEQGAAVDLVVADQLHGPMVQCEWAEWLTLQMNAAGEKVTVCRLKGSQEQQFYAPKGWQFEGSLSQKFGYQAPDEPQRYRFLRHEGGMDVYLDTATGREVYAANAGGSTGAPGGHQ